MDKGFPMDTFINTCLRRFHDPQISGLILVLSLGALVLFFFGAALAPYFTALVVAYLLEGMIQSLLGIRCPRIVAVIVVFSLFFLLLNLLLFVLLPSLAIELARISEEIPRITEVLKQLLSQVSASASGFVNPAFAENMLLRLVETSQEMVGKSVTLLLMGVPGLISVSLYLILVPFLVFFFMKDKDKLLATFTRYLPQERRLLSRVLRDVDIGVGGYVRGKFWEMLLLGSASYTSFVYIEFEYAFLVGLLTGLSVLIPFLGLAVVTVPVLVLGVFQWGLTWDALTPLIVYGVLQAVDGTILAPLILGETVKVHPTTIMLAVLLFGALWGVLGVFFAVPLAVLFKSVMETLVPPDTSPDPA